MALKILENLKKEIEELGIAIRANENRITTTIGGYKTNLAASLNEKVEKIKETLEREKALKEEYLLKKEESDNKIAVILATKDKEIFEYSETHLFEDKKAVLEKESLI
jgi:hypothetical protein